MQDYTVVSETGLILPGSDAPHAVGEVISLDPNDANTVVWLQSGAIAAVVPPAAPVEPAAPVSPFSVSVVYVDGSSPEDINAAATGFVNDILTGLAQVDNGIPAVIKSFTVTRD